MMVFRSLAACGLLCLLATPVPCAAQAPAWVRVDAAKVRVLYHPPLGRYPEAALAAGVQGDVKVEVFIGTDGIPFSAQSKDGPKELNFPAAAYVMGWKFEPVLVDGKPVKAGFLVTIPYALPGPDQPTVKNVVLVLEGSDPSLQPCLEDLRTDATREIKNFGLTVVPMAGADPARTYLQVLQVRKVDLDGRPRFLVEGRMALVKDREEAAKTWKAEMKGPGDGQPVKAALWNPLSGVLTSLLVQAGCQNSPVTPMYYAAAAGALPGAAPQVAGKVRVVDFEFRQIKVKYQPPPPAYPALAKIALIQGTVVVEITIDREGNAERAVAIDGPPQLRAAAEAYAMGWKFEPVILNGVPQRARFKLTMPFRLK